VITCSRQPFDENCPWPQGSEDHIQVDLADPENLGNAIAQMRQRINDTGGELHALVNNAGMAQG